jgi:hypothetical protein
MCAYDGSLNDKKNIDFALSRAKEHGLKAQHRKLTIITDGVFSCFYPSTPFAKFVN